MTTEYPDQQSSFVPQDVAPVTPSTEPYQEAPTTPAQPASVGYSAPQPTAVDQAAPVDDPQGQPVVSNDVDALDPEPGHYTMESGQEVVIARIKTRELFKFLKILTRGAGPLLGQLEFSSSDSADEFAQRLVVLAVASIPEAEEETMEFLQFIVQPKNLIIPERTKDDTRRNEEEWQKLAEQLANPEIVDTIGIVTAMVRQEAEDIMSLGKKIQALLPASLRLTSN